MGKLDIEVIFFCIVVLLYNLETFYKEAKIFFSIVKKLSENRIFYRPTVHNRPQPLLGLGFNVDGKRPVFRPGFGLIPLKCTISRHSGFGR